MNRSAIIAKTLGLIAARAIEHRFAIHNNVAHELYGDIIYVVEVRSGLAKHQMQNYLSGAIGIISMPLSRIQIMTGEFYPSNVEQRPSAKLGVAHWFYETSFLIHDSEMRWDISAIENCDAVISNFADTMVKIVLPHMFSIKSHSDLVQLWRSGKAAGISNYLRLHYIRLLDTLEYP